MTRRGNFLAVKKKKKTQKTRTVKKQNKQIKPIVTQDESTLQVNKNLGMEELTYPESIGVENI